MIAKPFRRALAVLLCAFGVGASVAIQPLDARMSASGPAVQEPAAGRSTWDGVYTDDQAKRGETQYSRNCEPCHGADLSGDPVKEIPALVFEAFLMQWGGRSLNDLYDTMRRSMPQDNPGGLNARAYVDLIAYLLQSNRMPSGSTELSLNADALGRIVIVGSRP